MLARLDDEMLASKRACKPMTIELPCGIVWPRVTHTYHMFKTCSQYLGTECMTLSGFATFTHVVPKPLWRVTLYRH